MVVDIFCDADSTSSVLYPAFMKLCFALVMFSPLNNAFRNPPLSSSSRFGVDDITILGRLHLALNDIVYRVYIQVLLIGRPLVLFCRVRHAQELCVADSLYVLYL